MKKTLCLLSIVILLTSCKQYPQTTIDTVREEIIADIIRNSNDPSSFELVEFIELGETLYSDLVERFIYVDEMSRKSVSEELEYYTLLNDMLNDEARRAGVGFDSEIRRYRQRLSIIDSNIDMLNKFADDLQIKGQYSDVAFSKFRISYRQKNVYGALQIYSFDYEVKIKESGIELLWKADTNEIERVRELMISNIDAERTMREYSRLNANNAIEQIKRKIGYRDSFID